MKKIKKPMYKKKRLYLNLINYLGESKEFIVAVVIIFFSFTIIGFIIPAPDFLKDKIIEILKQIMSQTQGLSPLDLIQFIFFNNLRISFFGLFAGVVVGAVPLLVAISNGYLLGFVSKLSVDKIGFASLLKLLPHGIFEIPALFISLGLGLKLGSFVFQENKKDFLSENLIKSLLVFVFIIIPLLLIAAIIEGSLIFLLG